jgi:protein arginine N-methyltransferase 1
MSLIVDEHRQYLSDQNRLDAYASAIEELVKPGCVVVDLGAGTGIMGLLACRAGASRVYCIEQTSLIGLTREIVQANGFADRFTFIKELSTQAQLPERADVVVSDQIGQFGFDAGIFEYFADARVRFLKTGGVLLPARIDLVIAPVEHEELWHQVEFWSESPAGFDFRPARKLAVNTGYPHKLQPQQLLASPAIIASLDTALSPASIPGLAASMEIDRAGTLHGIGGWFTAQLSPHVTMSNGPLESKPIERRNVFFPIDRPVAVAKGDSVRVTMTIQPSESIVAWTVEVRGKPVAEGKNGAAKARFAHSTFQGMLLSKEDLETARPEFMPNLTPRGEARRSILELCDGRTALAEIEREVYRRHPQLFPSSSDVAVFVAEVVSRYSQ